MASASGSPWRLLAVLAVSTQLLACAGADRATPDAEAPVFPAEQVLDPSKTYSLPVYDPLEGFNRAVYDFNALFDRYVFIPVVDVYQFALPGFARKGVSNLFSNLGEIMTFANSALQLKPKRAGRAAVRFAMNGVLGLAGLFDVATDFGIERSPEDLGQTLGHYGVPDGPYLVLPLFGPSNLRDTVGLIGDNAAYNFIDLFGLALIERRYRAITGLRAIDARSRIEFRFWESGSPFEYDLIRLLYTRKRRLDIAK